MIDAFPTDRRGLEILSLAECEGLLALGEIGRVAVVVAGEPFIVPVNYRYHHQNVIFRTAAGDKLDVMALRSPVAFQIDGWYPASRTGWSVLVRGISEEVYEEAELKELADLGLEPWAPELQPLTWLRIRSQEISGRRIT